MTGVGDMYRANAEHERRRWQESSEEERADRIRQRKEYLFAMPTVHPEWLQDILECPHCTPGTVLPAGGWPRWFLCHGCNSICVVDLDSHLTRDGQERIFVEPYEGLESRFKFYREDR